MVKDLVCGMGVEEDSPETVTMKYHETRYFFCSTDCLALFSSAPQEYANQKVRQATMAKDVVCGMEVDTNNPPCSLGVDGRIYYFCSRSCKFEFIANRVNFTGGK